jgi:hypothetical protein
MGSYAECWLESLYVGSTKGYFDSGLMQLFRESDKRVQRCRVKDLPEPMRHSRIHGEDQNEKIDAVYYTAPAFLIKDRLELKGYTLSTAKRAFMKRMQAEAKYYSNRAVPQLQDYYANRAKLLRALDVDQWLATLRHIKDSGGRGSPEHKPEASLEDYMLQNDWYGFSGVDLYVPLRLALETCAEGDNFIHDLTDLVRSEYFKKSEDFVALASEHTIGEYGSRSKIIILTEGSSDGWIIRESLKLLYPHLVDYFTFMDFEAARVEGGAAQLARIVKSFAGAGIVNKVIALFDNDTAGEEALQSLKQIKLPGNLRALKLPELEMLRMYPTIGPSGSRRMNVNGLAGSIELYLGDDMLRENGKLTPVQWSSFNSAIGKYQGGVREKGRIQKRFKEKLALQNNCALPARDRNWCGLYEIMSSIFSAFHPFDKKLILAEKLEEYSRE